MKKYILGLSVLVLVFSVGFGAKNALAVCVSSSECGSGSSCVPVLQPDGTSIKKCRPDIIVAINFNDALDNGSVVLAKNNPTVLELRAALQALVDARSNSQAGFKNLAWTSVIGATSYQIDRYNELGQYISSIKGITGTSYRLSNLVAGQTLKYRIYAVNGTKISPSDKLYETTADAVADTTSAGKDLAACKASVSAFKAAFNALSVWSSGK